MIKISVIRSLHVLTKQQLVKASVILKMRVTSDAWAYKLGSCLLAEKECRLLVIQIRWIGLQAARLCVFWKDCLADQLLKFFDCALETASILHQSLACVFI